MQATGAKSFIEMLEDEIRQDLRSEIEAEVLARFGRLDQDSTAKAPSAASSAAGRLETWLASNMGRTTFARPQAAARSYNVKPGASASTTAPGAAPSQSAARPQLESTQAASQTTKSAAKFQATTAEQLIAVELLARHSGKALDATFTEDELKSVWRKAALKTHPDRFAGEDQIKQLRMATLFRELSSAYEVLSDLVEADLAKAA